MKIFQGVDLSLIIVSLLAPSRDALSNIRPRIVIDLKSRILIVFAVILVWNRSHVDARVSRRLRQVTRLDGYSVSEIYFCRWASDFWLDLTVPSYISLEGILALRRQRVHCYLSLVIDPPNLRRHLLLATHKLNL